MTNLEIIAIISTYIFASIPFYSFFSAILNSAKAIDAKLERPDTLIYSSKSPYVHLIASVFTFLKGFLPTILIIEFLYNDLVLFAVIPLIFIAHTFPIFAGFQNRKSFLLPLWGVYTALYYPFFLILPILYLSLSLIFNTFTMASVLTPALLFLFLNLYVNDPLYSILNSIILVLVLISLIMDIIRYFEGNKISLYHSFQNR